VGKGSVRGHVGVAGTQQANKPNSRNKKPGVTRQYGPGMKLLQVTWSLRPADWGEPGQLTGLGTEPKKKETSFAASAHKGAVSDGELSEKRRQQGEAHHPRKTTRIWGKEKLKDICISDDMDAR